MIKEQHVHNKLNIFYVVSYATMSCRQEDRMCYVTLITLSANSNNVTVNTNEQPLLEVDI